jgi:hypothetical protein
MKTNELIENLYQHYEDYGQGRTQNFFKVVADCKEAAKKLEQLQALVQNEQSAIETNQYLVKRISTLMEERDGAIKDLQKLAASTAEICEYCEYDNPCQGEDCECYIEGLGMEDEQGKYYDWKWSCMDFDFGTCPMLENTPCNGCVQNDCNHFRWKGITKD